MYDLKIINGEVVDLNKGCFRCADIGIKQGKIVHIGELKEEAKIIVDAKNRVVSPGFIDIHMHEEKLDKESDKPYDIAEKMCLMGVTTAHGGNCGINAQDPKEFIEFVKVNGAPTNYMMSIGYNFLREKVGIKDNYIGASDEEIEKIINLIKEYVDLGFVGVSFGIEYSPGITFDEMVKVCHGIKGKNIFVSAHYRSDSDRAEEAIEEMINLSRITGVPMQISHLGSCSAMGMMKESLALIEKSIAEGVNVMVDCYPYDAFSTYIGSAVFDEGCFQRWNTDCSSLILTEGKYKGVRCDQELFNKVRMEHPNMLAVAFVMDEDEVIQCLKAPFVMVASDGLFNSSQGHPRGAGTFPRFLGRMVREKQAMKLIDALKKITLMPAERLGLKSKGILQEGMDADIVIFDSDNIEDIANFDNPIEGPKGIDYVIINGEIAAESGKIVNGKAGTFIGKKKN